MCPFCGCGCGIRLEVKDSHVVRVRPANESPVSHGALCVRGSYGYDFVHSPDRLRSPLVRIDGDLRETSWEDALERAASGFRRIREEHGADSLAVLGSSKCTNEENYLLQRFARGVLGTNNIDNGSPRFFIQFFFGIKQHLYFIKHFQEPRFGIVLKERYWP